MMNNTEPHISIPKDLLSTLPPARFPGKITVIDSVDTARQALRVLRRARVVGFDTETRPSFKPGRTHNVALMQLSTKDRCFLFRLNIMGVSRALCNFLQDPEVIKVGLSVHDDFNVLRRSVPDLQPQGFVELQQFVKQYGIADISLQKIYAIVFGEYMSKSQRLTNWEAPELTPHQQAYAAMDAYACLQLYTYLGEGRFDPDKLFFEPVPPPVQPKKKPVDGEGDGAGKAPKSKIRRVKARAPKTPRPRGTKTDATAADGTATAAAAAAVKRRRKKRRRGGNPAADSATT